MASLTQRYEFEQTLGDSERQGPDMMEFMGLQRVRHDLAKEQQNLSGSQRMRISEFQ